MAVAFGCATRCSHAKSPVDNYGWNRSSQTGHAMPRYIGALYLIFVCFSSVSCIDSGMP